MNKKTVVRRATAFLVSVTGLLPISEFNVAKAATLNQNAVVLTETSAIKQPTFLVNHNINKGYYATKAIAISQNSFESSQKKILLIQPFGSKIKLTKTPEKLEILIPPQGFNFEVISMILSVILYFYFENPVSLKSWRNHGWFIYLFQIIILAVIIWSIIFTLFGEVRVILNQDKIFQSYELIGLKCWSISGSRQNITQIEITPLSYRKDAEGNTVTIYPQINIWSGIDKFEFGSRLSDIELDWLAQELSAWLNLPITRN